MRETGSFGAAVLNLETNDFTADSLLPFDEQYMDKTLTVATPGTNETLPDEVKDMNEIKSAYDKENWRKIDFDWLYSAGSFALRMNGLTNNLSLAIAIEHEPTGKVLLFPGDAEFGSRASRHRIKWKNVDNGLKQDAKKEKQLHLTEDLLNRTVFYKVAHHLSHNGTAQRLGFERMNSEHLAAMATLDYDFINSGWTSTMPNRGLIKQLLTNTKGRLMIMNENKLFYDFHEKVPLKEKIQEARSRMTARERKAFNENVEETDHYIQYKVIF